MSVSARAYNQSVFINCPFDSEYAPIFDAIVFAISDCGFRPVCARERMNSGQVRIDKIVDLIRDSRYSIHDLSRTDLDPRSLLPRFNMPLELGIAIGCVKLGTGRQREKTMLILDRKAYRYHKFISDLAGQDISVHGDRPVRAVEAVRNWLRTESKLVDIPGHEYVIARYRRFQHDLPEIAKVARLNAKKLTYADYCTMILEWLRVNAAGANPYAATSIISVPRPMRAR